MADAEMAATDGHRTAMASRSVAARLFTPLAMKLRRCHLAVVASARMR